MNLIKFRPIFRDLSRRNCNFQFKKFSSANVEEVTVPVPWGHVAGRHWNPKGTTPVLCLHGWKDNAATFDTLLPLLSRELPDHQFLAIDLPGHGRSSHFPPGMIYSVQDMWVLIRRLVQHFSWPNVSFLSHSMGAQISFSYSGTHPSIVHKLVAIDALSPVVLSREETIMMIPKLTSDTIKFEEKLATGRRPLHTYQEIVNVLVNTHLGGLDAKSCEILMTRGVREDPKEKGKFAFTHDIRVKYMPITGISSRQVHVIARNFKSDVLYIKASDGINYTRPYIQSRMEEWLSHGEDGKPKGNLVRFVDIGGGHHLHLTHPESILPDIVRFMSRKHKS